MKWLRSSGPALAALTLILLLTATASQALVPCEGTWTHQSPTSMPSGRYLHAMAYDSGRSVTVLFGGTDHNGLNGETWEWDGANWSLRTPTTSPSPRHSIAMAYDSGRGVTVLFGGFAAPDSNETWEWDGTNWTLKSPAVSPSARFNTAMAYDSARGVTVLFGGYESGSNTDNDTWEWNGTTWTKRNPETSPANHYGHGMAYDSARGVTVLWGGQSNSASSDETWEWNGANWELRFPGHAPPARVDLALAYDSSRGISVLFGGLKPGVVDCDDTWEWDGTDWTQRNPITFPFAREAPALAYDSARGATVLFGGIGSTGFDDDTWHWTGPLVPFVSVQPSSVAVDPGDSATFSVTATGQAPLSYSWQKDGNPLSNGGSISGADTDTLKIDPTADGNVGEYVCVVGNDCGTRESDAATLTVNLPVDPCQATGSANDCDGNGILDSCDITNDPSLDGDGNGIIDSCESSTSPPTSQPDSHDSQSPGANQSLPCGLCGGGAAAMTPMLLLTLAAARRMNRTRKRASSTRFNDPRNPLSPQRHSSGGLS